MLVLRSVLLLCATILVAAQDVGMMASLHNLKDVLKNEPVPTSPPAQAETAAPTDAKTGEVTEKPEETFHIMGTSGPDTAAVNLLPLSHISNALHGGLSGAFEPKPVVQNVRPLDSSEGSGEMHIMPIVDPVPGAIDDVHIMPFTPAEGSGEASEGEVHIMPFIPANEGGEGQMHIMPFDGLVQQTAAPGEDQMHIMPFEGAEGSGDGEVHIMPFLSQDPGSGGSGSGMQSFIGLQGFADTLANSTMQHYLDSISNGISDSADTIKDALEDGIGGSVSLPALNALSGFLQGLGAGNLDSFVGNHSNHHSPNGTQGGNSTGNSTTMPMRNVFPPFFTDMCRNGFPPEQISSKWPVWRNISNQTRNDFFDVLNGNVSRTEMKENLNTFYAKNKNVTEISVLKGFENEYDKRVKTISDRFNNALAGLRVVFDTALNIASSDLIQCGEIQEVLDKLGGALDRNVVLAFRALFASKLMSGHMAMPPHSTPPQPASGHHNSTMPHDNSTIPSSGDFWPGPSGNWSDVGNWTNPGGPEMGIWPHNDENGTIFF